MNIKNKILAERVIDSIDWESILKIYKILGLKVGEDPQKIPGIRKLHKGEKMTADSIKNEISTVVNYVIENDIPELEYGPWDVIWVNGEWEIDITEEIEQLGDMENLEGRVFIPVQESVLELFFVPFMAVSQEKISPDEVDKTEPNDLNSKLKKALEEENYELASKIRDLINSNLNKDIK